MTAQTTACSNPAVNYTATANITVRSLTTSTAGPIALNGQPFNGQLAYCDTRAVTLSVPQVQLPFPNTTNGVQYAGAYEWTLPPGWTAQTGTATGAGSFLTYTNSIQVTLASGGAGVIGVRALDNYCTSRAPSGQISYVSRTPYFTQNIIRPTATITTAPFTISCGDQRPRTFSASVSQGTPTSYNWTLPTGWTFQGSATGATITALPNGSNAGNVSVMATYSCGGAAYTTAGATVAVGFSQSVAPVSINPSGATPILYCGTTTLTAEAVGATSYRWSATNGATVTPAVTTTANAPVTLSGGWDGPITVTVEAGNTQNNCGSSTNSTTLYHNRGVITEATNPLQLFVSGTSSFYAPNGSVTCGRPVQFDVSGLDLYGNGLPATIRWIVDGRDYYTGTTLATTLRQSQVTVVLTNACGYEDYYYWTVPVDGTCSGTGTGGGGGPFEDEPCNCGRAAYPNPASETLTVEQGGGPVRLTNAYGQPMRQQQAKPGRLHLDVRELPAGLYFLEMRDAKGKAVRQQVRITH